MGLLGGAASSGMHQNYKQNKKLGSRKKPLQERLKGYETKSKAIVHDKKMSPEEYQVFRKKLAERKKHDQIRMGFLFAIVLVLSIFTFIYIKDLLGM